jgi:ergothioneine biosynthesis protein EgtB
MKEFTPTKKRYLEVRKLTEDLCKPLNEEDLTIQPIEDVSPPKWHLAHTTWFFETFILIPHYHNYKVFNENFNYIFNSYYENKGKRILKANRGNMSRPSAQEVFDYRKYIDAKIIEVIEKDYFDIPKIGFFLELGLNHEQQHQELLVTDIKYILGNNPLLPAYNKPFEMNEYSQDDTYTSFKEGIYEVGHGSENFFFDNERPRHKTYLHSYKIMNRLVTNSEYLEFIKDGSYSNFNLWLSDGWAWLNNIKISKPLYWHEIDGEWHYYTLSGLRRIDPNAPVTHISFYEAEAFARWAGKRLPTEQEWEVAASELANCQNANLLNLDKLQPVNKSNKNNQFIGDVWEWTNSSYLPYPNYKKDDGALGEYNGKFMINQMVLRGGSCATPVDHVRITYRNFFQTDKRWQFTGIRLAENG